MTLFKLLTSYIKEHETRPLFITDKLLLTNLEEYPNDLLLEFYEELIEHGYDFNNQTLIENIDESFCLETLANPTATKEQKLFTTLVLIKLIYPVTRKGIDFIIERIVGNTDVKR